MAPLSVHSSSGGATSVVPTSKARRLQHLADRLIGGDAAGGDQRGRRAVARAEQPQARAQPVEHDIDHRLLKAGAKIGDVLIAERRDLFGFQPQRGLQAGQREIGAPCGRASAAAARSGSGCRARLPSRPAVRPDSRGRAAWRSCRRPRRWRRPAWCRAAHSRRRRARRRSGCGRRRRETGNRETACRRSAARSAHALPDD